MYVKKFEAETMNEAFNKIKQELGPDAIILKTTTNKGIKRAFKKNKIEITAAISEKNYIKKSKVDHVLNDQEKEKLYKNNSSYISKVINTYNKSSPSQKNEKQKLNEFLQDSSEDIDELEVQRKKISELENKLFKLSKDIERFNQISPQGIFQLRTLLQSLGIHESCIQDVCKSALFELSKEELEEIDPVFEFALREMLKKVHTALPLFGSVDHSNVITVLLSEISCGQTSILYKLGALKDQSVLIRQEGSSPFAEDILDLKVQTSKSIPEYISSTRHAISNNQSVFLDYKCRATGIDETKSFVDSLRRSFTDIEVLICFSAVHSQEYNKKIVSRYAPLANGLIATHLDLCLNYGHLLNITDQYKNLPFKFFGTGKTIPEDIEAATAERILAGIFQFGKKEK